jgi:hypothetical protein
MSRKRSCGVRDKSSQKSNLVPPFPGALTYFIGEIDPSSPHSGIQYGDALSGYSNPPSLFGTAQGTIVGARNKIRLGRRVGEIGEWGEVFSGRRGGGCCST